MHEPYKYTKLCITIFFKELFQNKTIKLQLLWSIISLFLKIENKTEICFNRIMNALLHFKNFKEKSLENFL